MNQFLESLRLEFQIQGISVGACFGYGQRPSIASLSDGSIQKLYSYDDTETDPRDDMKAVKELAKQIKEFSTNIQFAPLVLPHGVIVAQLHRHNHILGRYLEDYKISTDSIIKRWDFLIFKSK